MKTIIRKYYTLPKADDHLIEKPISELKDGDLILDFMDYRSSIRSDYVERRSAQKNLYKVLTFDATKMTQLADEKTVAIVFDKPVGMLSFNFFYNVMVKVKQLFGIIDYETYLHSKSTTRHIVYFCPNGYRIKEGESLIKTFKLDDQVTCVIEPEILLEQLNQDKDKTDDSKLFWVMNYSKVFEPIS